MPCDAWLAFRQEVVLQCVSGHVPDGSMLKG